MHPTQKLILKLSSREKSYFKKLNKDSSQAEFMQLYNVLIKNPTLKLTDIKKEFKGTTGSSRLHVELNYLHKHLLRSLHIFHLKANSLTRFLSYAEILIKKKELKQASKIIKKLKEKAYQEEELEFILNAINLAGKIKDEEIVIRSKEDLTQEYEERSKILTEIQDVTSLKKLKLQFLNLHYNHIFNKINISKEVHNLENELSEIKFIPFTFLGKDLWYSVSNLLFQSKNDLRNAQIASQKRLTNINSNIYKVGDFDQLKALNNYLFITILKKDYAQFEVKYLSLLKLENSNEVPKEKFFYFKTYLRLGIELKLNNTDELNRLIPIVIGELRPTIEQLPSSERNELLQFIISACIVTPLLRTASQRS